MTELRNTIICGDCSRLMAEGDGGVVGDLGKLQLGPYLLGPNDAPENGIYCGDARELAEAIPDESVDLVFTDPPYSKEFLPLYEWLARLSKRILTADGFLIAMAGNYWKDRIFEMVGQHLQYFWDYQIDLRQGGCNSMIWPRKTIALAKSLLVYRKNSGLPRCNVLGLWSGSKRDKRYHVWGQDESSARYYIDCFSGPGQIVIDPFCGGGTTPAVCKILGRKYLAFEVEPDVCEISRERVRNAQRPWFVSVPEQLPLLGGHYEDNRRATGAAVSAWNSIPAGQPLGETRQDLLSLHLALGEPCSCGCGNPLQEPIELHHAILTRKKCQGVSAEYKDIWDHPINLALVNKSCHERIPGPRHFWALACERCGEKAVRAWYREAQARFKSRLETYD